MDGEFKPGDRIEDEDDWIVVPGDLIGYTIDYSGEAGCHFRKIVVWEDEALRDLIIKLLNRYYAEIPAKRC
jgi:hypothetical protein